jgi:hypothetical protein
MTFATREEALELLDNFAADDPLTALREYADCLSEYRLDMCAIAEPAAALVHCYNLLTPARQAYCIEAARAADLTRYVPDRLGPERRKAIEMVRGFGRWEPSRSPPASNRPRGGTKLPSRMCNGCGSPMPDGRADRQWCSSACRQAAYRRRRAAP